MTLQTATRCQAVTRAGIPCRQSARFLRLGLHLCGTHTTTYDEYAVHTSVTAAAERILAGPPITSVLRSPTREVVPV